jgi:hypothetical protein
MFISGRSTGGLFAHVERLEQRALYSAVALSSAALSALAKAGLPDLPGYSVPASHPVLPAGADAFTPPVRSQALANGVPVVATSNLTANSGDTLTLTGASLTNDSALDFADTQDIVYGQTSSTNGTLSYAQVQSGSSSGVLATIPSNEPGDSMYLVWPENSSGIGAPIVVNGTQAQWMGSVSATPASTVSVYGRNMANGAGESWVYLQPSSGTGEWAVVTSANAYRVQFTLPANFTPGSTYQVWVYNGHGGNYGWSVPLNLTVAAPTSWSSTVNVKSFGATGNGVTNDGPAIETALHSLSANQTLYFPAGTYVVDGEQLLLPNNVRIEGAGPAATSLDFQGYVPNQGVGQFDIGVADFDNARNIDFESIGLTYSGPAFANGSMVRERSATDMTFNNVLLQSNSINAIDWEGSTGLTLTNSTVISNALFVNASTDIVLDGDRFLQAYDIYGQAAVTFDGVQDLSVTNCITENYYDYELSVNPNTPYDPEGFGEGRFLEFGDAATNVYVAGNQSINLGESLTPSDHNSGEQINVEGSQDVDAAPIISATNNSFTFSGEHDVATIGMDAMVLDGVGLAQQFEVTGASYNSLANTTTYTINKNFAVLPQPGDKIDVAIAPTNMVFYQNTLNHTTGALAGQDQASTGIEFFSGGSGIVIDDNTISNTRTGVNLANSNVDFPMDSIDIVNNIFNSVQTGVNMARSWESAPDFVGVVVRGNTLSGVSTSYLAVGPGINVNFEGFNAVQTSLTVVELNHATGFEAGLEAGDDLGTLIRQNSFGLGSTTQNVLAGIDFDAQASNVILQGNTYSGYTSAYGGIVPQSAGQALFSALAGTFYDPKAQPDAPSIVITSSGGSDPNPSAYSTDQIASVTPVAPVAPNAPVTSSKPDDILIDLPKSNVFYASVQYTDYGNTTLKAVIGDPTASKIFFKTLTNTSSKIGITATSIRNAPVNRQSQHESANAYVFDGTMTQSTFWALVDKKRLKKKQASLIGQVETDLN